MPFWVFFGGTTLWYLHSDLRQCETYIILELGCMFSSTRLCGVHIVNCKLVWMLVFPKWSCTCVSIMKWTLKPDQTSGFWEPLHSAMGIAKAPAQDCYLLVFCSCFGLRFNKSTSSRNGWLYLSAMSKHIKVGMSVGIACRSLSIHVNPKCYLYLIQLV